MLPSGTVTFLFTDIEGSTELLQRLGEQYPPLLGEHHRILQEAVEANGGVRVDTEGDGVFAVFRLAPGALKAAVEAQLTLAGNPGPMACRSGYMARRRLDTVGSVVSVPLRPRALRVVITQVDSKVHRRLQR